MIVKTFEVRDSATFIPVLAIKLGAMNAADAYLLERAGYGNSHDEHQQYVLLARLEGGEVNYDRFKWGNRTMHVAHGFIEDNFDSLESGQVVDVQYILGETKEPKKSEATTI